MSSAGLATKDGHAHYARFGFSAFGAPKRHIETLRPDVHEAALEV